MSLLRWPELALLNGDTFVSDNSTRQLMSVCPTMAAYKILFKREHNATAPERDCGKAVHVALEHRYKKLGWRPCDSATEQEMLTAITGEYLKLTMPEDTHLTLLRLHEVVQEYNRQCQQEPFKVLGVEIPLGVPLGVVETTGRRLPKRVNVIWTGRSDMLTTWDDGTNMPMDHKTTSRWDESRMSSFDTDEGQAGYMWSLQELARLHPETGLPAILHGFCINALIIRKDTKSTRAVLPRFEVKRVRFYKSQELLEEWRLNTLEVIKTWLWHYEQGVFPMHRKSCANYFGRKCGYFDVDSVPASQRQMVLASDYYRDATWNPIDRDGAKEDAV